MINLLYIVLASLLCAFLIIFIRNDIVFRFRMKLLNSVDNIVRPEVVIKLLYQIHQVSYQEMVWKFWRPLKSFYPEEILQLLDDENKIIKQL